ncbi:U3 small nucleolar RNA-associated protein 6 homolog [Bacillus rossius redtenbacheri]|uniref:U3 small nucleolar RNA-associated protein 6 homolog n=1 Tax=Bacillus rossius redtenbacheri TaxID=93214 RepID=UPI002FDE7A06
MAEFIEYRMEEMIQELEQMERTNMFDKQEVRTIGKMRKEFEAKIQRQVKSEEDFLRYIQYEIDVLNLVKVRRQKMGLSGSKADIEYSIANRLNRLFRIAVTVFKDDIRIWAWYLSFCKRVGFHSSASNMLARMLAIHSDKPSLWKCAATVEFEEMNSVENARQYLMRGLRFHPESRLLHLELFKLELTYADMKRKESGQQDKDANSSDSRLPGDADNAAGCSSQDHVEMVGLDQVKEGKIAEVMYEMAVKKINDVSFITTLLSTASKYDFTQNLQRKIINDLLKNFPNDELTWNTMARRELEGLHYTDSPFPSEHRAVKDDSKKSLRERIKLCVGVYVAAFKKVNTERMWSLYIDTLLEINEDTTHLPVFKKKLLREAFQGAHAAGKLAQKYYKLWAEMLQSTNKVHKLDSVLRVATERFPQSPELWLLRLRFHIALRDEVSVNRVFRDAVVGVGGRAEAALPLWRTLLLYYQDRKERPKVETVFKEGLAQPPAVSRALKPLYLEWAVLTKGIIAGRKTYKSICMQPPFSLELHLKMVSFECFQPEVKLDQVRKCFNTACEQFGKTNTDVWLQYVKFEHEHGEEKCVSELYWRAVKTLEPSHTDTFISEFNFLRTGLTPATSSS